MGSSAWTLVLHVEDLDGSSEFLTSAWPSPPACHGHLGVDQQVEDFSLSHLLLCHFAFQVNEETSHFVSADAAVWVLQRK